MFANREPLMVEIELEFIKLIKHVYYFYNYADPLDQYNMCPVLKDEIDKLTNCFRYIKKDIDSVKLRGEPSGNYFVPQFKQ